MQVSASVKTTLFLLLSVISGAIALWLPRPVAPIELPSLKLDKRQVERVIREDRVLAKRPLASEEAARIQALVLEKGESEREATEPLHRFQRRRLDLARAVVALRERRGDQALVALRAKAVEMLEKALALQLSKRESQGVLGAFPVYLERYGATRNGEIVAPRFLIRTMYKSRWNVTVGLDPTFLFKPVERLAHFGWLALHADNAPIQLRIKALQQYALAGGRQVAEANGVLHFLAGNYPQAVRFLSAAYQQKGSFRLRNYLLGAKKAGERGD
ncbi:MAG: hypothetical protein JXA30_23245 [Deltaproteobacteria bacterium]|nr:hypothetical protein [Deltaproteobacteria bacterium]